MTFDKNFTTSISFSLPSFLGGNRKGEKNNKIQGQKPCLSAWSKKDFTRLKMYKQNIYSVLYQKHIA